MDFYSVLRDIVEQIPRGRVATLSDIALSLGDRVALVALPSTLREIYPACESAGRAVRADGTLIIIEHARALRREGLAVSGSRVCRSEEVAFKEFKTRRPLKLLRDSQLRCAKKLVLRGGVKSPSIVAGVDVSYFDNSSYAAAIAVETGTLRQVEAVTVSMRVNFPYIPGYLAYRELPAMLQALKKLRSNPDVILVDGHGTLHPAGCGVASHVGIKVHVPTIGVAKNILVGELESRSMMVRQALPVRVGKKIVGYALRSSVSKHPIYISPGNHISPKMALGIVKSTCKHRVPEPIRLAHIESRKNQ